MARWWGAVLGGLAGLAAAFLFGFGASLYESPGTYGWRDSARHAAAAGLWTLALMGGPAAGVGVVFGGALGAALDTALGSPRGARLGAMRRLVLGPVLTAPRGARLAALGRLVFGPDVGRRWPWWVALAAALLLLAWATRS